jgi:hypothetical protein
MEFSGSQRLFAVILSSGTQALRKKLAPPPSARSQQLQQQQQMAGEPSSSSKQMNGQQEDFMSGTEFVTMDEIYKVIIKYPGGLNCLTLNDKIMYLSFQYHPSYRYYLRT